MKKRVISMFISAILLMTIAVPIQGATVRGVDRNKIKTQSYKSYPAILTIGTLSFEGVLARRSNVTEEDIEKAIERALKKFGKTEAEIGEAESLVEKVAREDVFTAEDSRRVAKEIRDFIAKQTGTDILVETIEHIMDMNDRPLDKFLLDTAGGAIQDKAADLLLGKLGGPVTNVVEGLMFLSEKHDQDKQKWKNRAEAVNAKRMLTNFYGQANINLHHIAKGKPQGWAISMDATDSRYFSFFGIPGNLEMWTIVMYLNKNDGINDTTPKEWFSGFVDIEIKYEMSKFDEGMQDKYKDWIDGLYTEVDQEMGFKWRYENGGSPTYIYRKLNVPENTDFDVYIYDLSKDMSKKTHLDFTGFEDYKEIRINRHVERTLDQEHEGIRYQAKSHMLFSADSEEFRYSYDPQYFRLISDGYTGTLPEQKVTGEIPWDESIWEYFEEEKTLKIDFSENE